MKYLTGKAIVRIHDIILKETGGRPGVLHSTRLLSLRVMPKQKIFGQELYPSLFHKAAVYVREINQGHIFNDGNKRTSLAVLAEFLRRNKHDISHAQSHILEDFALAVAGGLQFEEIVKWIMKHGHKTN